MYLKERQSPSNDLEKINYEEHEVISDTKQSNPHFQLYTPIIGGFIFLSILVIAIVLMKCGYDLYTINCVIAIGVVIAAVGFDFINGMSDAANSVATVISTRVMAPTAAIIMAAIFNFIGAMIYEGVATSIATKIVASDTVIEITPLMIFCGLIGAVIWSYIMSIIGMPVSMSHSLIGGIVGVFFIVGGFKILNLEYLMDIVIAMFTSPIGGIIIGWIAMVLIMWIFRGVNAKKASKHFRFWQIISAAYMSFMHGSNDAQKAMGIITLALITAGLHLPHNDGSIGIPFWVKLTCATVIGLGTAIGGEHVIKTVGTKIFKITPAHGCVIQTVSAAIIHLCTHLGIPISTTHVLTASVLGVGSSKRFNAVRWGVAGNIVVAWVITIPTCAASGALLYVLVKLTGLT